VIIALRTGVTRHPYLGLSAFTAAFLLWGWLLSQTKAAYEGHLPGFDLVVAMEVEGGPDVMAVFLNADWVTPRLAAVTPGGVRTYVFTGVPAKIHHLRIDPVGTSQRAVRITSVTLVTPASYRPAPDTTLYAADTETWQGWGFHGLEHEAGTGRFVTTNNDPQLVAGPDLDLIARLPRPPSVPVWVGGAAAALAVSGVALLAALVWFLRTASAAHPTLRAWGLPVGLAFAGWSLTLLSSFPGHTNFDEFYSLSEQFAGRLSDVHPPMQTVAWATLIDVTGWLGLPPLAQLSSMLAVQATLFWAAAAGLAMCFRSRGLRVAFLLTLALLPPSLAYLGHIGKDSQLGVALFVATTLLAWAMRRRSGWLLALALPPLFYGFAVRSNAPPAVLPLCLLWVVALFRVLEWDFGSRQRRLAGLAGALALFLGFLGGASAFYRAVVKEPCCLGSTGAIPFVHDLMGISYRIDQNIVPPIVYSEPDYSLEKIKQRYYPADTVNLDGFRILAPGDFRRVLPYWINAVREHPLAYLNHRWTVLRYFLGFTNEPQNYALFLGFYTTNRPFFGLPLAGDGPQRLQELLRSLERIDPVVVAIRQSLIAGFFLFRDTLLFRPWFYIVLLVTGFVYLGRQEAFPLSRLSWYLGGSAVLYCLPFLLLATSGHFRYVWWPVLATLTAVLFRLDETLATAPRDAPTPATWRGRQGRWLPARLVAADGRLKGLRLHPHAVLFLVVTAILVVLGRGVIEIISLFIDPAHRV
jgi:hypothetical protein